MVSRAKRVTESGQVSNLCCQPCKPRAHSGLQRKIKNKKIKHHLPEGWDSPLPSLSDSTRGGGVIVYHVCTFKEAGEQKGEQKMAKMEGGKHRNTSGKKLCHFTFCVNQSFWVCWQLRISWKTENTSAPFYEDDGECITLYFTLLTGICICECCFFGTHFKAKCQISTLPEAPHVTW